MNNNIDRKKKNSLKDRLKDKRERAKLELIIYGIFFILIVIFARTINRGSFSEVQNNSILVDSFVTLLDDNYEYDVVITYNDNIYYYYGRVLGNNRSVYLKTNDTLKKYRYMNNKYYSLVDDNFILVGEDEVYPYIDYRYFDLNNIKEYMKLTVRDNNTYNIKISDIVLNSNEEDYVIIKVNEGDKNIIIDYTSLFKLSDANTSNVTVNITYSNIDNVISLEE